VETIVLHIVLLMMTMRRQHLGKVGQGTLLQIQKNGPFSNRGPNLSVGNIDEAGAVFSRRMPVSIEGFRIVPAILMRYPRPAPKSCREQL
jgi:hypothetical protein